MIIQTLTVLALLLKLSVAFSFPAYDPSKDHPFITDTQFSSLPRHQAIIGSTSFGDGRRPTKDLPIFIPGLATYVEHDSGALFADNLDALFVTVCRSDNLEFLRVTLTAPARVFILIKSMYYSPDKAPKDTLSVTGLPQGWGSPRALRTQGGQPITFRTARMNSWSQLDSHVVAVEKSFGAGEQVKLPCAPKFRVNGRKGKSYALLFAQPGSSAAPPTRFPYQQTPATFTNRQTGVQSIPEQVRPNEDCPAWVHDMYVTPGRDNDVAQKEAEPRFWKTWHAPIEPYFWCYFGHEHGAYPGKYKPMLDYMAWKTQDSSTSTGRQNESNGGFKIAALPLYSEKKYVVLAVHMHLSSSRRFSARHHTIIFAVLNDKWELEMELHMKGDFGFAFTRKIQQNVFPLNSQQEKIRGDIKGGDIKFVANRRFNVLDARNYPDSVDKTIRNHDGLDATEENRAKIMKGNYEQWKAVLTTCSKSPGMTNAFIDFDVTDPATAKLNIDGPNDPMQWLSGDSRDRNLKIAEPYVDVGFEHCIFKNQGVLSAAKQLDGVFYTDSYFKEARGSSGPFSPRQFIKPGFEGIRIKGGKYRSVDQSTGHYMAPGLQRRTLNPEGAILASMN